MEAPGEPSGMTESSDVGARLKRAREARNLSQVALAKSAGVDQTTISKAERGKLDLGDTTAGRIADALGVSVGWLLTGSGTGPAAEDQSHTRRIAAPPAVFEEALETAFDKARGHRLSDVDVIRRLFSGESVPVSATTESLERIAARLLDAAAELRREGDQITMPKVLMKVAS